MLRSVAAVFEEDINQNEQLLAGAEVRVLTARSGHDTPHLAVRAVTQLCREVAEESVKTLT